MTCPLGHEGHVRKTSRFTEEQIAFALKQAELGTKVQEICRKLGISEALTARSLCRIKACEYPDAVAGGFKRR